MRLVSRGKEESDLLSYDSNDSSLEGDGTDAFTDHGVITKQ